MYLKGCLYAIRPVELRLASQYPMIAYSNMCALPSLCDVPRSYNIESLETAKRILLNDTVSYSGTYASALENDIYIASERFAKLNISDMNYRCSAWAIYRKGTVLSFIEKELLSMYT